MNAKETWFPVPRALGGVLAAIFVLTAISIAGCGGTRAGSFQSKPTNVPLVERNYKFVQHGLRGEACRFSFLGFGIQDHSYAAAINEIHKQVEEGYRPDYQLVNVVDDWSFKFFGIAWQTCTVVSADVVVLSDVLPATPSLPLEAEPCAEIKEEVEPAVAEAAGTAPAPPETTVKSPYETPSPSGAVPESEGKKSNPKKPKKASESPYTE